MHGIVGSTDTGFVIAGRRKYPHSVVVTAINVLAKNINASAIPSTNANLAEFFKISKKL
jgi:hypothetical protein